MKLHEDKDAFGLLLENIHDKTGYRTDVLEKDYYILLILQELSNFQADGLPAYFKGGTALYKALKTTNRFSEDIDLSAGDTSFGSYFIVSGTCSQEVCFPSEGCGTRKNKPF